MNKMSFGVLMIFSILLPIFGDKVEFKTSPSGTFFDGRGDPTKFKNIGSWEISPGLVMKDGVVGLQGNSSGDNSTMEFTPISQIHIIYVDVLKNGAAIPRNDLLKWYDLGYCRVIAERWDGKKVIIQVSKIGDLDYHNERNVYVGQYIVWEINGKYVCNIKKIEFNSR